MGNSRFGAWGITLVIASTTLHLKGVVVPMLLAALCSCLRAVTRACRDANHESCAHSSLALEERERVRASVCGWVSVDASVRV